MRTRPEISEQVGAGEDEADHHEDNPLQLEREEGSEQETRLEQQQHDNDVNTWDVIVVLTQMTGNMTSPNQNI